MAACGRPPDLESASRESRAAREIFEKQIKIEVFIPELTVLATTFESMRASSNSRIQRLNLGLLKFSINLEDFFLRPVVSVLLLFTSLPDCSQNQTAVSDALRLLSDF